MTILVVGGGKMGMSHLALVSQYVGKKNVALCDTKLSTRILFRLIGYKTFDDVEVAASKLDSLDGVLIATPTSTHERLAKWAINKRIPCFVEKPLTLDVNASKEIRILAAENGVFVQVGFVLRYVSSFRRLRQLVKSKELGEIHSYTASMRGNVILRPPGADSWQGSFRKGGGCLNEYGPHIIDLCQFIFGPVDRVGDARFSRIYCTDADDLIEFKWSHRSGCSGKVEIDWCDATKRKSVIELNVKFDHGEVRVDNSVIEFTFNDEFSIAEDKRQELYRPVPLSNVAYYLRGEEFSLELEEFLGVCLGRRMSVDDSIPHGTAAQLEDGFEVDRLIDEVARKAGLK